MKVIAKLYGLYEGGIIVENYGSGLINKTWLITGKQETYLFQKINKKVFTAPELIDENIQLIKNYLQKHNRGYNLIAPITSLTGKTLVHYEHDYYRMFKFIPSKTYTVVKDVSVAFEAAKQFGKFTKNLSGLNTDDLYETIPHFHNLNLRYTQFLQAIKDANKEKLMKCKKIIELLQQHKMIVETYDNILQNASFKKRIMHHDTKISNVLFDDNTIGIGVIDLDTVMPGYFISDVGDMLRTYLSPINEEEINFDLIEIRDEYFKAVAQGYLSEMKEELSAEEINAFVYAGKFMICMQALRFITDYLNNDVYYDAQYPLHNFNRAQNQLRLLKCLIEKEDYYNSIVQEVIYKF